MTGEGSMLMRTGKGSRFECERTGSMLGVYENIGLYCCVLNEKFYAGM